MNGWMDEWATSLACYFFIERPLRSATSSLSSLLSGLLLLWPCSELHPRQLFGSFCSPILLFVQLLAASSCNPAKQERRSITHALLRAAVPMCFVAAGCKPDSAICISKSQKRSCSEHFWKMRSAKCAPDCSESSICTSKCLKGLSRSEQFWKMRWAKWAPDCSESSISHKIRLKKHKFLATVLGAFCRQLCQIEASTGTSYVTRKTQGFVPESVFTGEFTPFPNCCAS